MEKKILNFKADLETIIKNKKLIRIIVDILYESKNKDEAIDDYFNTIRSQKFNDVSRHEHSLIKNYIIYVKNVYK
jgi:hypothetical protein